MKTSLFIELIYKQRGWFKVLHRIKCAKIRTEKFLGFPLGGALGYSLICMQTFICSICVHWRTAVGHVVWCHSGLSLWLRVIYPLPQLHMHMSNQVTLGPRSRAAQYLPCPPAWHPPPNLEPPICEPGVFLIGRLAETNCSSWARWSTLVVPERDQWGHLHSRLSV